MTTPIVPAMKPSASEREALRIAMRDFLGAEFPVKVYADRSIGAYLCRCVHCRAQFIGHKRDPSCGACPPAPADKAPSETERRG